MTSDDHKTVPDKLPAPSPLDDLEAPSPDVADAQRKGFAAHVAVQKGFHQAADELAGPGSGTGVEGPALGAPTQLAKPVVSTKPGLGPAAAPADGLALSLGEADSPSEAEEPAGKRQTRRLDTATLEAPRAQREASPRRTWLIAIVALAVAVLLLVFLLPREPDTEQAASPSASPSTPGASAPTSVAATASTLVAPVVSAEPRSGRPESSVAPSDSTASGAPSERPSPKSTAKPKQSEPPPSPAPATATSVPTPTAAPTPSSDLIFDMDKKR